MTASELADELENTYPFVGVMEIAATMLRQQQAEIEALKQIIDANNLNQNIGQFVKPTNEPVAWMDDLSFFTEQPDDMDGVTPLYTHQYERPHNTVLVPCDKLAEMQAEIETLKAHPIKELTDEEIEIEWFKVFKPETGIGKNLTNGVYEFALAILRKAQEK